MTSPSFESGMLQQMRTMNSILRGIHSEVHGIREDLHTLSHREEEEEEKEKDKDKKRASSSFETNHNIVKGFLAQEQTTKK